MQQPITRLKQFRFKYNLSQKDISKLLNINIRTIKRWDTGKSNPHPKIFELLKTKI